MVTTVDPLFPLFSLRSSLMGWKCSSLQNRDYYILQPDPISRHINGAGKCRGKCMFTLNMLQLQPILALNEHNFLALQPLSDSFPGQL